MRKVFVTGAASGIGRAVALSFAQAGAAVLATDRDEAGLTSLMADADEQVSTEALDVSDADAIERVVNAAAATLGGLDVVVNNAGIVRLAAIDSGPAYEDAWSESLAVMATAHQRIVRAALPALLASDAPRIVNVASTEGLGATGGNSAYVAAKHAVVGLTRALAVELGPRGVTVNCVCPGPINTGLTAPIPDEAKVKFARRRTALGRYGDPEEVAAAVLFCAAPEASFLTGVALPVDGGLLVKNG